MKTLSLSFAAMLMFFCSTVMAQSAASPVIRPFGIGLHIEQFKVNDLSLNNPPPNKLVFTINPGAGFRIEPEIGFAANNNKTDELKSSSAILGIGIYGMKQKGKLNIYGGGKINVAVMKYQNLYYSGGIFVKQDYKTTRLGVGPVLGCEYFLGDNFTVGGEMMLKYATSKTSFSPNPTNDKDEQTDMLVTETGLFLRFFF